MVAVASAFQGINADYGIAIEENGPSLPAIQATTYQPRTMSEKVKLCLSPDSFDMLDPESGLASLCIPEVCNFGEDDESMWVLPEGCRFVVMGLPKLFVLDKGTGVISRLTRGEKLAGTKKVTITRLTLAMIKPDGEVLLGGDGRPQLFTLKLKSNKTSLVTGDRRDPDFKSLADLNKALQAHFEKRGVSLTHLVSVGLDVVPRKFTSGVSGESSTGIIFTIGAAAKPLPESQQLMMFQLLQDPEVLGLIQDPFRLKAQESPDNAPMSGIDPDDIDF
jgi:hypothetical protein